MVEPTIIDEFQQLQHAICGCLKSSPYFANVAFHMAYETLTIEGAAVLSPNIKLEIDKALAGLGGLSGASTGVAGIIGIPTLSAQDSNSNLEKNRLNLALIFSELVTVNFGAGGTRVTAMEYAARALAILNSWRSGGQFGAYGIRGIPGETIVPLVKEGDQNLSVRIVQLNLYTEWVSYAVCRPATPVIKVKSGIVTITCKDAANIWVTLDGSFPWPSNVLASEYSSPFALFGGGVVKSVAYPLVTDSPKFKTLVAPSNVAEEFIPMAGTYYRPDGVSLYLRPDGISSYFRPN